MAITTLKLVVFCVIFVGHEIVSIQSSKGEDYNFEKQHEVRNDSIIKSIKTKYGSIYDCVDFYKQPAFDHPSLNGHNFHPQMRPEFAPGDQRATKSCHTCQQNTTRSGSVILEDEGCPTGTVPIKRISKNDFIQMKRFTKKYASRIKSKNMHPLPGHRFAILQTNSDPSKVKYHGVKGIFNIYRLSIKSSQYTSGEIIIQNEEDSIQMGWTVNPSINKNSDIHLFQYLNAGQSHCFNTLCPGFVITSTKMPIDAKLVDESKIGGPQMIISLTVYQDDKDGNWWLEESGIVIGFWPRQIFKTLGNGATYIAVGGETYSPPGQPLPPMGSGYYAISDPKRSGYCHNFNILDTNYQWVDPQNTQTYVNDDHYGVYDVGQFGSYERTVFYGGTTLWA